MLTTLNKILFVLVFSFLTWNVSGQEAKFFNKLDSNQRRSITKNVFNEIEMEISTGKASSISRFLSGQTYLSLSNGVNGYYSSNQAFYILEDYFKIHRVISFKLQSIKTEEDVPYAIGIFYFDHRGKRGTARVYISLNKSGNNWKISQLTIN
ncbi:MAG: hypothetical protein A2315_02020 [Ignavibacteria bacterium RIFOXYB2_FULL_35_12]|nr:MAG: hypothetical protein A2006_07250 [Ignavibacteria bacterium GWC2_35_8]OGU59985.1 MAG: hypothetical protein A2X60_06385 [Ignavibacteria bacterium GWF2_35_20]OGU83646.1 MAG: hypothetical protein A2254_04325 [Ignavibacteria bacterium RIFOXYA2_FULL_35_9]OGU84810.1 MAG: hypothetical protein A3K31_08375 [Ignavibacteria bacterium RIFOXYA12_FULL_35_25]OGU89075.1 MAG: hypothetical protein A2492_13850 [Ignavibacteria bacterium RIFOXYC12_FULL_35_11]OGU94242.1 MAG: hypothetical protein A2347_12960 